MSRALLVLLAAGLLHPFRLALLFAFASPAMTAPPAPIPSGDSAEPKDRVAAARLQHGETIRAKYHAAGVDYPGEIFLRWLKREAIVELWARTNARQPFRLISTYPILSSSGAPGPKRREGDRQAPEGFYEIDRFNPLSAYHLSLGLNYPNAADRILSDRKKPGGDIYIHGKNVSIGCAPLGDDGIEEVYLAALDAHTRGQARLAVHVFPARMTGPEWDQFAADEASRRPELTPFWTQLRPAYEYFEQHRLLPQITVTKDGSYVIAGP